jgi:hypothetical protein
MPSRKCLYDSVSLFPVLVFAIMIILLVYMEIGELHMYFLTNIEEFASVRNYHFSLHPEVFRVSYFSQGTEVLSSG